MDPFSKCEENTCFLTKVSHFIVAHRFIKKNYCSQNVVNSFLVSFENRNLIFHYIAALFPHPHLITLACYTIHFLHQEAQYDVKVFFNVFNNCFVKLLSILTRKSSIQAIARIYFGSWHDKNTDACRWHSVRQWRQTKGLIPPTPLPGGSCNSHTGWGMVSECNDMNRGQNFGYTGLCYHELSYMIM